MSVLLRRSPEELRLLSRVLPMQVSWRIPDAERRRQSLSIEERVLVEELIADYDKELRRHNDELIKEISRRHRPDVQEQFVIANQTGKAIINSIALDWKYKAVRGGPGEWGLIADRKWGRITISLNLSRTMHFGYHVTIVNERRDSIRNGDDYLVVLGVVGGSWEVKCAHSFSEKIMKVWDFAAWHVGEYEAIIGRISSNS